ncbi:LysR family transcriptional regulator [Variovorax sp. PAMC26660]|uniref:LysR family transcriptional regulator n=1 Tax=Variovorax sp. PAMC26660 TaxID=2762322 RepID=UPI0021C261BE|nr:LysR family transcriptional regulator [Variovorax sp. PAMC26660]
MSKQMAALEQTLGARLFRRNGCGMALTDRGQQLFRTMNHSYGIVDAAYGAAAASPGRLSIATVNTLAAYLLPDAMVRLAMLPKRHW